MRASITARIHTSGFLAKDDGTSPKVEGGVLQNEDADKLTTAFGRGLGLL